MIHYTTIRKTIKEFDVLISNDPREFGKCFKDDDLLLKNLVRVYCVHEGMWGTCIMSKEMLNDLNQPDDFIHKILTWEFNKIKMGN